jgi:5-bromo-4-chloroindolyl phosphate hydrolysis protein
MKNEQIIQRLNTINEEIAFLEEVSNQTSEIEERLENLRTLRYELERKLHYDKITTAPADQEGC